jgi:cellulose synthase/poly-beta-1,6-N-acetylglucosamine synthase-like glycosyltransferase
MGNNMLISREAYEKVGGFSAIPFSLTEDFEIAKRIKECGFKGVHQVRKGNLIFTVGIKGFPDFLQQRKRWMAGAFTLPFYWKFLLALQVMFFPAILILLKINPTLGGIIWILKIGVQGLFVNRFSYKVGERIKLMDMVIFEIYYLFTSWSTIVYYFWPSKTDWKGRLYP